MKSLIIILAVAVVATVAHPERERRSVVGLPVIAPAAIVGHPLGGAVITAPAHGATVVTGPVGTVVKPWGHVVPPVIWG